MSCYGCLTKFSIFTKEHSCPNCGLSFCTKCLKEKINLGGEQKSVCKSCFKKFTSDSDAVTNSDMDTPDLLLKRLEGLENPAKPPITIFRHSARLVNLKHGLSSEDKKILERLERLKADHAASALPDENEIKRRLAQLQGRSSESLSNSQKLDVVHKTQQEEVEGLLTQYIDETGIDTDMEVAGDKKTEDIESRLKKLRVLESSQVTWGSSSEDFENEDSETMRIIKRAIAEGQLERKLKDSSKQAEDSDISDLDDDDIESETPWCIICNANAEVKCFGCDGSLYCNVCFKQGHEFFDMKDHKNVPYTKRDSLSDD